MIKLRSFFFPCARCNLLILNYSALSPHFSVQGRHITCLFTTLITISEGGMEKIKLVTSARDGKEKKGQLVRVLLNKNHILSQLSPLPPTECSCRRGWLCCFLSSRHPPRLIFHKSLRFDP